MPKTWEDSDDLQPGKANLNNDAFYRVVFTGTYGGQANVLTLAYRIGLGQLPGGMNFGGAEHLANLCKDVLWDNYLKDAYPGAYTLQTITAYPYNGDFDPLTQLPFTLTVDENGVAPGDLPSTFSAITCAFNLEGMALFSNGYAPPKRGYVAFGPHREVDTDNLGRLTSTARDFYLQKLACLALDLVGLPFPVTYWPVRISTTRILDILTLRGFTDISGVTIRPVATTRRSRKLEA